MKILLTINQSLKQLSGPRPGSALLLAMFIVTSIIIIALGGSSLALVGIRMAGVQSQSTKAYFAAEAGAERLLFEVRRARRISLAPPVNTVVIPKNTLAISGASYWVRFTESTARGGRNNIFTSLGAFLQTRRSVDLRF